MSQQSANLSSLPSDLWSMILKHDAEKKEMKKEINELLSIIDYFADYVALTTSHSDFSVNLLVRIGGEKKKDLFVSDKVPDLKRLGESLFAQLKCIAPLSKRSYYVFATGDDDKDGTNMMWDIELLRSELFLHSGRELIGRELIL
jgi:hypothetical protein